MLNRNDSSSRQGDNKINQQSSSQERGNALWGDFAAGAHRQHHKREQQYSDNINLSNIQKKEIRNLQSQIQDNLDAWKNWGKERRIPAHQLFDMTAYKFLTECDECLVKLSLGLEKPNNEIYQQSFKDGQITLQKLYSKYVKKEIDYDTPQNNSILFKNQVMTIMKNLQQISSQMQT